jgi:GntR family transcriptional regulator / MocR family aminotransferase
MRIPLDHESKVPLYQQIENHLRQSILAGSLAADTRLPATRQMAKDLGINRITVEAAYAELEADGLVYSQVGSGTYVQAQAPMPTLPKDDPGTPWPLWQQEILASCAGPQRMSIDQLLRAAGHPHPISFAGGIGDPHLFPSDDYRKVVQKVLRRDGIEAFEYGDRSGYAPLRESITHVLGSQGFHARPENILITAGSQQALALVSQLILKPGDTILVEEPTYAGALDLFRAQGLKLAGVPVDERGMQVEKLERQLQRHHPKLIYTIPNFHNPTGTCLSGPRRHQLLALADRYNVPILEDDFVGDLRYDGRAQPALKSLDPGGRVIYVSTFSKMVMPGLRVGFLVAEGPVYERLVDCKRVNDLATSSLHQRALELYVTVGRYQVHLRRSSQLYRKRREAMMMAIHRYLPAGVHAEPPQGGLFIWLELPENCSAEKLLPIACSEGVAFSPGGSYFLEEGAGERFMRINFATHTPEENDEGIKRLAKAIRRLEIGAERLQSSVATNPTLKSLPGAEISVCSDTGR